MKITVRFNELSVLKALVALAEGAKEAEVKSYNYSGDIKLSIDDFNQYSFRFYNASGYYEFESKKKTVEDIFEDLDMSEDSYFDLGF